MDIQNPASVAVSAFFLSLEAGVGITQALADLYETGVEAGKELVLEDPQSHDLVRLPC